MNRYLSIAALFCIIYIAGCQQPQPPVPPGPTPPAPSLEFAIQGKTVSIKGTLKPAAHYTSDEAKKQLTPAVALIDNP